MLISLTISSGIRKRSHHIPVCKILQLSCAFLEASAEIPESQNNIILSDGSVMFNLRSAGHIRLFKFLPVVHNKAPRLQCNKAFCVIPLYSLWPSFSYSPRAGSVVSTSLKYGNAHNTLLPTQVDWS